MSHHAKTKSTRSSSRSSSTKHKSPPSSVQSRPVPKLQMAEITRGIKNLNLTPEKEEKSKPSSVPSKESKKRNVGERSSSLTHMNFTPQKEDKQDKELENSEGGDLQTPVKFRQLSDRLSMGNDVNINSKEFNAEVLKDLSIKYKYCNDHAVQDLQTTFPSFPLKKLLPTIGLSQNMFPGGMKLEWSATQTLVEAEATRRDIKVKWFSDTQNRPDFPQTNADAFTIFNCTYFPQKGSEETVTPPVSFFFFGLGLSVRTNLHPLRYTLYDGPALHKLKPDIMISFFKFDDTNDAVVSVVDIPQLQDTCKFLTKIREIGSASFGHKDTILPLIIFENKTVEPQGKAEDIAKLFVEMCLVRKMMHLIWTNPPEFNFGFYVAHTEWRVFMMDSNLVVRKIFHDTADSILMKNVMGYIMLMVVNYMKDMLASVEVVSPEIQEDILKRFRTQKKPTTLTSSTNPKTGTTETTTNQSTSSSKPSTQKGSAKSKPRSRPEKKTSRGRSNREADKENRTPNNNENDFKNRNLVLSPLYDNIFGSTTGDGQVILKVGSSRRIQREVDLYTKFRGPFFASLLEVGTLNKKSCIMLRRYSRLPSEHLTTDLVLSIAKQVVTALSEMHSAGFIHGDVKNSNIMWDESSQEVKVIDFETAKEVAMADKVEGYFGTTTYMAPEVLNDKWVSHKSDVFSAGLVVASLIYATPIKADSDRERVLNLVTSKTRSPLASAHTLLIVQKMLSTLPYQRIGAAEALKALTEGPKKRVQPATKKVAQAQTRTPLGPLTNGRPVNVPPAALKKNAPLKTSTQGGDKKIACWSDDKENAVQKVVAIGSRQSGLVIRK